LRRKVQVVVQLVWGECAARAAGGASHLPSSSAAQAQRRIRSDSCEA